MSKPKARRPAGSKAANAPETPPWQGALMDEVIVVTRLEVEAREDYDPERDGSSVELRRWLRISKVENDRRSWFFDFEVASPQTGSAYRFLVHLFATIDDGDPGAEADAVASAIMNRLSPRLYSTAGEQLFAATVRGPWGPMSLPPQGPPAAGLARRIKEASVKSAHAIVDLLAKEGPMAKSDLAGRLGDDLDEAFKVAMIQGLIEEEGSLVRLRTAV